jgi:hypothetical protein
LVSTPYTPAPDPSDLGIRRPVIILLAPSQAGRFKIDMNKSTQVGAQDQLQADGD